MACVVNLNHAAELDGVCGYFGYLRDDIEFGLFKFFDFAGQRLEKILYQHVKSSLATNLAPASPGRLSATIIFDARKWGLKIA